MKGTPLNYCQGMSDNISQTRLADLLIPGVPGPSPRCSAVAGEPLAAAAVLTGIPPSRCVISPSFGLAGTASIILPLPEALGGSGLQQVIRVPLGVHTDPFSPPKMGGKLPEVKPVCRDG